MYTAHFGLDEKPFSIAPDPRYLYMSGRHREALAHLIYGIKSDGGFVLLTGEVGTGKTTVCRCLLEQLPDNARVAFVFNPRLTVAELLATVCDEFGIEYPEGNSSIKVFVDRINAYLLEAHRRGDRPVLIIDEAQNLSTEVLEQIRLLTNLETNQRKLLQIIMLGQPELRDMLARPELRQLRQRITARYHLEPLSPPEVNAYVSHRLAVAGVRQKLFGPAILKKLYRLSGGIPRLINLICDRALLGAYVEGESRVNRATLVLAAREVFGSDQAMPGAGKTGRGRLWTGISALVIAGVGLAALLMSGILPVPAGLNLPIPYFNTAAPGPDRDNHTTPPGGQPGPDNLIPPSTGPAGHPGQGKLQPSSQVRLREGLEIARTAGPRDDLQPNLRETPAGKENSPPPARQTDQKDISAAMEITAPEHPAPPARPVPGETTGPAEVTASPKGRAEALLVNTGSKVTPVRAPALPGSLAWPAGKPFSQSKVMAFQSLFEAWQARYEPARGIACRQAGAVGLSCLFKRGTLKDLIGFNRPAVLTLTGPAGRKYYVTLTGLHGPTATLIVGTETRQVPLGALTSRWTGAYTLLWRPPPGYQGAIRPGFLVPWRQWLLKRLAAVAGPGTGITPGNSKNLDGELLERVRNFQKSRNLAPDGIIGPQTLIHLNTITDREVPTLSSGRGER